MPRFTLRHNIRLLMLHEFFGQLRLFYPVSILVFTEVAGSYALGMSVFAVASLAAAVFEIPTGYWSDTLGRKRVLVIGSIAEFLAVTCYTLAFVLPGGISWLYVGAISYGFAGALFSGNNQALIYDTLAHYRKADALGHVLGRIDSSGQIALMMAGLLALILLWLGSSFFLLCTISIVPLAISVIVATLMTEPPRRVAEEAKASKLIPEAVHLIIRNPQLRGLAIANVVTSGLSQAKHSFMPGFVSMVWPVWLTPAYRLSQNALGAISFWFSGRTVRQFGALKTLLTGTLVSDVLSFIAYMLASFFSPLLLALTQIPYALKKTADSTLQQENFSVEHRATMASIISLGGTVAGALFSVLLGTLADTASAATALIILLLIGLPVNFIYIKLYNR